MKVARQVATALAAVMVAGAVQTASAQTFNYYTTGQFLSGAPTCNNVTALAVATCTSPSTGALTLTFTGVSETVPSYANGSSIVLGSFAPTGLGSETVIPPEVEFRLVINQTNPTTGTGTAAGYFTGTFSRSLDPNTGNFSNLLWEPNQYVQIDPTTYKLTFDTEHPTGIVIGASFNTSVNAVGTVPEPSSMALLGTGLVGLVPMIRRRNKK